MDDEEGQGQLILSPQPSHRKQLLKVLHPFKLALQSEHSKNEALLAELAYLRQLIELGNEQWARHVSLLELGIEQMKAHEVKIKKYNATKLDFLVDSKERKASSYKEYAESAETDLEDAHTCIAALGAEIKALKMKEEMSASISEKDSTISQLKQKFQASISKKDDMISGLNGEVKNLKKMLKEKDQMISGLRADVAKFIARVQAPPM